MNPATPSERQAMARQTTFAEQAFFTVLLSLIAAPGIAILSTFIVR